jgi:hypothetical protein
LGLKEWRVPLNFDYRWKVTKFEFLGEFVETYNTSCNFGAEDLKAATGYFPLLG